MKNAFTMIELIFVIVIIGILAAVAIPKLTATRDDARVSEMAMNIMQGVSEIASYAISHGDTEDNLSKISNGIASLVESGNAELNTTAKSAVFSIGSIANCLTLEIKTGVANDDANLTLTVANANSDQLCTSLQSAVDPARYPMKLRGANVKY